MSLYSHVNATGFPLQLAVANAVRDRLKGEWDVLYEEHAWRLEEESGFLDLVLEDKYKTWLMNIECKRVRESDWIFLLERPAQAKRRHAKLWVSHKSTRHTYFDWADVPMDPSSVESRFCIINGQDPKARPMLERAAATLIASTEALAKEEDQTLSTDYSNFRFYQSVIVTTATLQVCNVDVSKIDIASGEVPSDATFTEVPYVRFRKQLGAGAAAVIPATGRFGLDQIASKRESTVFVVNSAHFLDFVRACEPPDNLAQYVGAK